MSARGSRLSPPPSVTRRLAWVSVAYALARRPGLWRTAWQQWRQLTPPRWWQRRPYLPVPSNEYLRFRILTQYGDIHHPASPHDVLNYLAWCRQMRDVLRTA